MGSSAPSSDEGQSEPQHDDAGLVRFGLGFTVSERVTLMADCV